VISFIVSFVSHQSLHFAFQYSSKVSLYYLITYILSLSARHLLARIHMSNNSDSYFTFFQPVSSNRRHEEFHHRSPGSREPPQSVASLGAMDSLNPSFPTLDDINLTPSPSLGVPWSGSVLDLPKSSTTDPEMPILSSNASVSDIQKSDGIDSDQASSQGSSALDTITRRQRKLITYSSKCLHSLRKRS
jgi:hypothetical protein